MPKTNILLESGTNELEIVEFSIGSEHFCINVAKVREIIRFPKGIVPVPNAHPSIVGVVNLRGKIIPVVHLAKQLGSNTEYDALASRVIITEFNKISVGFWVSAVTRIHRVPWDLVESPSSLTSSQSGCAVAVIKLQEKILFLLDFERIASEINPDSGITESSGANVKAANPSLDRSQKTILVVEDSPYIARLLIRCVERAGYKVRSFPHGRDAWDYIEALLKAPDFEKIENYFHLIITDIEMPQMDGLYLVRTIKENPKTRKVPCIVFSSMISPEISLKCKAVGADDQISKPDIDRLLVTVDHRVL